MSVVYIVSGKGFYKETIYNELHERKVIWVNKISNAKSFKSGEANKRICNLGIDAWVWNPYEETPIKDRWDVVQRSNHYNFLDDENNLVLEWMVIRMTGLCDSDVKFIKNKAPQNRYYSYDEAIQIAKEKNIKMLEELQTKINKL